jgi:uncharacterized protein YciI
MIMGTYVATTTISPELREAHFEALKVGGRLPRDIAPSVEAHLQYIKELSSTGKILASGLTVDFTWGLTIIIADSLEEAKCIAENDPSAKAGLITDFKVEPWYHMV